METEHKIDDALVNELIEQLIEQTERQTTFPPSKEKAGTPGGE